MDLHILPVIYKKKNVNNYKYLHGTNIGTNVCIKMDDDMCYIPWRVSAILEDCVNPATLRVDLILFSYAPLIEDMVVEQLFFDGAKS